MLSWALIASAVSLGLGGVLYLVVKNNWRARQTMQKEIDELAHALDLSEQQRKRLQNTIAQWEEINAKANDEKQKLHTGDAGADARGATDVMRSLSGGRRKDCSSS
jgi:uncharacterized protein HemX